MGKITDYSQIASLAGDDQLWGYDLSRYTEPTYAGGWVTPQQLTDYTLNYAGIFTQNIEFSDMVKVVGHIRGYSSNALEIGHTGHNCGANIYGDTVIKDGDGSHGNLTVEKDLIIEKDITCNGDHANLPGTTTEYLVSTGQIRSNISFTCANVSGDSEFKGLDGSPGKTTYFRGGNGDAETGDADAGDAVLQGGTEQSGGAKGTAKLGNAITDLIALYGGTGTAQQSHIADPTGGSTIDTEARTAINAILVALETLNAIASS